MANVQDGYFDLQDVATVAVPTGEAKRFELRPGDVLILEGNGNPDNLGRGAVWTAEVEPCLHQNHVHAVRPHPARLLPEYLALVIKTEWARHFFTSGSAQVSIATLSQSRLGDLSFPVPSLAKQASLVHQATKQAQTTDELRAALSPQIALLQEHRQALITAAVTGELPVPGAAT